MSLSGILMLAGMVIFALFVAFVVGPAISTATGVDDTIVSAALGAVFLAIAVGAMLWAKSLNNRALNKKNAAGGQ